MKKTRVAAVRSLGPLMSIHFLGIHDHSNERSHGTSAEWASPAVVQWEISTGVGATAHPKTSIIPSADRDMTNRCILSCTVKCCEQFQLSPKKGPKMTRSSSGAAGLSLGKMVNMPSGLKRSFWSDSQLGQSAKVACRPFETLREICVS